MINLSAPPSANLMRELCMITARVGATSWMVIPVASMVVFALLYTLMLFFSYAHGDVVWIKAPETRRLKEVLVIRRHLV